MAIGTSQFREHQQRLLDTFGLDQTKWSDPEWKALAQEVTQEVLHEAHGQLEEAKHIFAPLGTLVPRSEKTLARVQERAERGFFAVSDWIGFRVNCELHELAGKVDMLQRIALAHNGVVQVKALDSRFIDSFHLNCEFQDISRFVHVFIPAIGFIAEIQINHPFASYTFASDTRLRNNPGSEPNLWTDGFYGLVKNYILDKANGLGVTEERKKNILEKASALHNGNIPEALLEILNAL